MDLFQYRSEKVLEKNTPLANRLRPVTLEEFIGQEHILGKNTLLYRAINADKLVSLILYGPSGTGKTTLAKIIANTTKSIFKEINGVVAGAKDIKLIVEEAKISLATNGKKTILFIDEIHSFNKTQQDILLPYVENGMLTLIGATTENPYFEINRALISRSIIFKLEILSTDNIKKIILSAINDKGKGFGNMHIKIDENALEFIANICDGDARIAINAIELAILTTHKNKEGLTHIDIEVAQNCIQKRAVNYDKSSDNHYDTTSAFIKSMRGSNPDASVYYLAKMIYAGEDPKYIARRIVIFASEDIGNADPTALQLAMSTFNAVQLIGMPEARIILSQAVCYMATAPKSNASYIAIDSAISDVKNITIGSIPNHLKDSHYKGAKNLGNGINYNYPHNYQYNYIEQQYLPNELKGTIYYKPTNNGHEKNINKLMDFLKNDKDSHNI